MLRDIFTAPHTQVRYDAGLHVLIVAVSKYEGLEPLSTAGGSYRELASFWQGVALRHVRVIDFEPVTPVVTIRGILLDDAQSPDRAGLLTAIMQYLSGIHANDMVIVHWIGHGVMSRHYRHKLLLPGRILGSTKQETFDLGRLTTWFGYKCRAHAQVFFIDCCSTKSNMEVDPFPESFDEEEPVNHCAQYILVGSGVHRPGKGLPNGASLFTSSILRTFQTYAGDRSGNLATGDLLLSALAGVLKEEWMRQGVPGFPPSDVFGGRREWSREFVQDVPPECPFFRPQLNRIKLGKVRVPRVHGWIAVHEPGKLRQPELLGSSQFERILYTYTGVDNRIWAWAGDVEPGGTLSLAVTDGVIESQQFKLDAIPPIAHRWLSLRGQRFE